MHDGIQNPFVFSYYISITITKPPHELIMIYKKKKFSESQPREETREGYHISFRILKIYKKGKRENISKPIKRSLYNNVPTKQVEDFFYRRWDQCLCQ